MELRLTISGDPPTGIVHAPHTDRELAFVGWTGFLRAVAEATGAADARYPIAAGDDGNDRRA